MIFIYIFVNMILYNKKILIKLIRLIKFSLQTNKSYYLEKMKKYTFIIHNKLKKPEIKYIFEKIFNLKIKKIQTINLSKKNLFKKIYITLQKDENLYFNSLYNLKSFLW